MKTAAIAEVVALRESLLSERLSMKRGAKYWDAEALHPHNREVRLNALGVGSSAIVAMRAAAAAAVAEAEARAAAEKEEQGTGRGGRSRSPQPQKPMQKPHTANTGFCSECDRYVRLALADQFGYKVAAQVLKAATVAPTALEEVRHQDELARLQRQPIFTRRAPMALATARARAEFERADKAGAVARMGVAAQRSKIALEYAERADAAAARLDLAEPASRTTRHITYDDKWIENFDEESGRLFYYNVTSGRRQWARPPVQPWNLATGTYTPLAPPTLFPNDIDGENAAHIAERKRLDAAASRALASIKVRDARKAGVGSAFSEVGKDAGPASARVIVGTQRVQAAEAVAPHPGARLAGERPVVAAAGAVAAAAGWVGDGGGAWYRAAPCRPPRGGAGGRFSGGASGRRGEGRQSKRRKLQKMLSFFLQKKAQRPKWCSK